MRVKKREIEGIERDGAEGKSMRRDVEREIE